MTTKENEEFTNLKYIRAERGCWTPEEQERWNILHDLKSKEFLKKIKILDEMRMIREN
jgi:hypothetical protein